MSVTEILESAEKLETKSFERLYQKLYAQRIKRNGVKVLNETESTLLNEINKGFDIKKWERLKYFDWKLESEILNQKEEMESLKLAEAYESYSGRGRIAYAHFVRGRMRYAPTTKIVREPIK